MSEWMFQRDAVGEFRFVRCMFDAATGVAQLVYAFDDGPELIETVTVPGAPFALDAARAQAVEQALRLLHLIAGVSYFKAAVPNESRIDSYGIDAETASLLENIYVNGLGEFAYRNGLDLRGRIKFPVQEAAVAPAAGCRLSHLALLFIPVGVGVMTHLALLSEYGLRLVAVIVLSTWIGMAVTALVLRLLQPKAIHAELR